MNKLRLKAVLAFAALGVAGVALATEYIIPDGSANSFHCQMTNALTKLNSDTSGTPKILTISKGTYQLNSGEYMGDAKYKAAFMPYPGTIIRGDPSKTRDEIVIRGNSNVTGFYTLNRTCILQNLTLEGFTNSSTSGPAARGHVNSGDSYAAKMTLTNCVIRNCSGNEGGALYRVTLIGCVVTNNVASNRAGAGAELRAFNSYFADNYASPNYGGALTKAYVVSNCVFVGNKAQSSGGAIWSCDKVIDCAFTNNTSGAHGGAVSGGAVTGCSFGMNYAQGEQSTSGHCLYNAAATNCVFDGENVDLSTQTSWGFFSSCPSFVNCIFKNYNVYLLARGSTIEFINCLFADSTSSYVFLRADTTGISLKNCTVVNTQSKSGLIRQVSASSIDNSIFFSNKVDGVCNDFLITSSGTATGSHNCYGVAAAFPVTGDDNFQVSKVKFLGTGAHPYQLHNPQSDARILRGGAVGSWTAADKDLAGMPRLHTDANPVTIGLGCYECWANPRGLIVVFR